MIIARLFVALFVCSFTAYPSAELTAEGAARFDHYIELVEANLNSHLSGNAAERSRLRDGEVLIDPCDPPQEIYVPGGMIQDWRGAVFIPRASIEKVRAVLQDYDNYGQFYKPEVIESKLIAHQGNDYDIFLRLRKRQVLTVVLNTRYRVHYALPDPHSMEVSSRSTRIAEVKDPARSLSVEYPLGRDSGFLWRLNSYWRFEEADGGVYAECRAVSLSRDVPLGLGWMIKGFVTKFPKESMQNTLRGTKAAVERLSSF